MDRQLFALLQGFFCLTPIPDLLLPQGLDFNTLLDFFITHILVNSHSKKYPPSTQYQKRFWKWAIEHLECMLLELDNNSNSEVDSQIYDHYMMLSIEPASRREILQLEAPTPSYVTYFWRRKGLASPVESVDLSDYDTITLLESRTTVENGKTGLRTWLASFALAQYLCSNPEIVAQEAVLELGSGIGFLGIVIANLQQDLMGGRGSLYLTDSDPQIVGRCQRNLSLPCNRSSAHSNINCLELDWKDSVCYSGESPLVALLHQKIKPNIILGADVVFDPSLILYLVETLRTGLQGEATTALIALTLRNLETLSTFRSALNGELSFRCPNPFSAY
ncbi:hypothetical protein CPB83DRAFT_760781 [Crepidotus variabilis]|uniref:Uncharacterized protein n=1 Tax=Crepidotus variabilis TaxID=179855 RepID=A0A9P6ELQ9_9AGAR|nr:hypothetical protein CPB83DRAFT_760781 [Crepidotus variabilis]